VPKCIATIVGLANGPLILLPGRRRMPAKFPIAPNAPASID
jgi:hypothetical protein